MGKTRNFLMGGRACRRRTIARVTNASDKDARYWQRNTRWIAGLLLAWLVVTLGLGWGADKLDFDFFGWPFGFWAAAQGALVVYVVIVAVYARVMNRLDAEHGATHTD